MDYAILFKLPSDEEYSLGFNKKHKSYFWNREEAGKEIVRWISQLGHFGMHLVKITARPQKEKRYWVIGEVAGKAKVLKSRYLDGRFPEHELTGDRFKKDVIMRDVPYRIKIEIGK